MAKKSGSSKKKTKKEEPKPPPLTEDQQKLVTKIEEEPKGYFSKATPDSFKADIERAGFKTEPLGDGNLKGVSYEDGGGFRAHYGGDGYLQYHPEKGSHHKGAYYKTSSGKYGIRHFDLNGDEIIW